MARNRKPFKLGLDPAAYNPTGLKSYERKELEHEYSRLRREAWDRLRKLGQSEFAWTKTYKENKDHFKPLKEIGSDRELRALLTDAARFVMSKTSSASGLRDQRRKQVESNHRNGLTWVNTKNHRWFSEWAEALKQKKDKTSLYQLLRYTTEQEEPDEKKRKQESAELEENFKEWLQQEHPDVFENLYPNEPEAEEEEEIPEQEDDEPEPETRPRPRSRSRRKTKRAAPRKRKYRSRG